MQAEKAEKEKKKKEKLEAHLYTIIKVARDQDFATQIGSTQFFDLVDNDKVQLWLFLSADGLLALPYFIFQFIFQPGPVAVSDLAAFSKPTLACPANLL